MTLAGVVLLAVSLTTALWCIVRMVFGTAEATVLAIAAAATFVGLWVVLPRAVGKPNQRQP